MKNSFKWFLDEESQKYYFKKIVNKLDQLEQSGQTIYPKKKDRFRALDFFKPSETKLIIIGQDPYFLENQADGLAFSTRDSKCPRSLQNIIKEIKKDYPESVFETYQLDYWAKQGVLLLNAVLSVEANKVNSHIDLGWKEFIFNLLDFVLKHNSKVIFGLWGNNAKKLFEEFKTKFNYKNITYLLTSHPSPLSYSKTNRSFKDSMFFKKINEMLESEIDFSIRKVE
ncbi:uracil-DNA glycosylase [Mycoplasma sp. Mirounga ES2805-ORL]|uniref:uracil-DNA glycosylase n=1 Tax=Mycoplasma sp. Mirounga ES2805-ORL TaxID=754514 RepID=UPI00197C5F30|nr:uracil-DNA glycosylase [Mycoplasma sp. Mirounga ES2805-ORL]QSF13674.1 uracil-DNA glycosylase [Mycoplasma sp. Mirounga ES2805-ORL]